MLFQVLQIIPGCTGLSKVTGTYFNFCFFQFSSCFRQGETRATYGFPLTSSLLSPPCPILYCFTDFFFSLPPSGCIYFSLDSQFLFHNSSWLSTCHFLCLSWKQHLESDMEQWTSIKFESESEVGQSCPTLCDPVDCRPPGSCVHGISQARILEWVAISFSRGSSRPRDRTRVTRIAGRHFNL